MIHIIQCESRLCGVVSVVTWYIGESVSVVPVVTVGECVSVGLPFVVKALKDSVEQMSDHDDLPQSVCWTVSCVAFATDG